MFLKVYFFVITPSLTGIVEFCWFKKTISLFFFKKEILKPSCNNYGCSFYIYIPQNLTEVDTLLQDFIKNIVGLFR